MRFPLVVFVGLFVHLANLCMNHLIFAQDLLYQEGSLLVAGS